MVLQRRKAMRGIRHPKKQVVAGACHLCAAEVSLLSAVIFLSLLCSFCMLVYDVYECILFED